jgi:hypothetical protein
METTMNEQKHSPSMKVCYLGGYPGLSVNLPGTLRVEEGGISFTPDAGPAWSWPKSMVASAAYTPTSPAYGEDLQLGCPDPYPPEAHAVSLMVLSPPGHTDTVYDVRVACRTRGEAIKATHQIQKRLGIGVL